MTRRIDREEVRRLQADGATLAEVLPAAAFESAHIKDATSLPLGTINQETGEQFGLHQPIIVYCNDYQ